MNVRVPAATTANASDTARPAAMLDTAVLLALAAAACRSGGTCVTKGVTTNPGTMVPVAGAPAERPDIMRGRGRSAGAA